MMNNSFSNLNATLNKLTNSQPVASQANRRRSRHGGRKALQRWGRTVLMALSLALGAGLVVQSPQLYAEEAATPAVVNINTADAAGLAATLKGIGHSRAQEIVRHRKAYGPFASPDELMEVKGIGKATLDMNRQRITLK